MCFCMDSLSMLQGAEIHVPDGVRIHVKHRLRAAEAVQSGFELTPTAALPGAEAQQPLGGRLGEPLGELEGRQDHEERAARHVAVQTHR